MVSDFQLTQCYQIKDIRLNPSWLKYENYEINPLISLT